MKMFSNFSVYRTTELPIADIEGTFIINESLISATRDALEYYALAGIRDGGHEGLVFWGGVELSKTTVFTTVIIPKAEHSFGRVMVSNKEVGLLARSTRKQGIGLLCQVHSHPGSDARHSEGDDSLITMPFEGMLSIVVPNFGINFLKITQAQIHQFQKSKWVLCTLRSVNQNIRVVPTRIDLR